MPLCSRVCVSVQLGGYLYDVWRPSAPFALIALCNGLVVLVGIAVLVHSSRLGQRLCVPPRVHVDADEDHVDAQERKGLLVQGAHV